jgi:predicted small secreted protein
MPYDDETKKNKKEEKKGSTAGNLIRRGGKAVQDTFRRMEDGIIEGTAGAADDVEQGVRGIGRTIKSGAREASNIITPLYTMPAAEGGREAIRQGRKTVSKVASKAVEFFDTLGKKIKR